MFARTTKIALALAALTTLGLAPATAKADHHSYKYVGQCYHYGGEAQMIKALEILELAYWEKNDFIRHDLAELAHKELQQARFAVRSGAARQYLQLADTYIHYFESTCSQVYLDRAAAYIRGAIQYETQVCFPHQHITYPWQLKHGGHPVHHGGHPVQHHGGHGGHKNVQFSKGGLHIGGKKGGFTIKW